MTTKMTKTADNNDNQGYRIIQLSAQLDSIKAQLSQNIQRCNEINGILVTLKQLDGKINSCMANIASMQQSARDFRGTVDKRFSRDERGIDDNKEFGDNLQTLILNVNTQLSNLKVKLAENDGQTNQCYIAIQKIEQKLKTLQQSTREQDEPVQQKTPDQKQMDDTLQRFVKRVIAAILATVGISVLCYIGKRYISDYFRENLPKIPQTQARPQRPTTGRWVITQERRTS